MQILWLFGDNHEVTEVGAMNILFLFRKTAAPDSPLELVTAPLDRGDVLPGSCLSVCVRPPVCLGLVLGGLIVRPCGALMVVCVWCCRGYKGQRLDTVSLRVGPAAVRAGFDCE